MSKETIRKCDVCDLELVVTGTMRSFWRQRFEFNVAAVTKLVKSDGYSSDEITYHGEMCIPCYDKFKIFVKRKGEL